MAYPTDPIYKLYKSYDLKESAKQKTDVFVTDKLITKEGDTEIVFPMNEENRHYQQYLEWKAIDGNEPEAAD
jgi:hypothetical protein|tara:strand:+ start:995 stop:1210 length:216 start_codon:yes stop_codon:yes gene_type:complete